MRCNLINLLEQRFPLKKRYLFSLYPFSNEHGFPDNLACLEKASFALRPAIGVALLFGESNFLSCLPELALHADIIVMADISKDLHQHTQFLLNCFNKAINPREFETLYLADNPLIGKYDGESGFYNVERLTKLLAVRKKSLGDYFFLASDERYACCKVALATLKLSFINFDVLALDECQLFAAIMKENNAVFTLCNFTNIHHYAPKELIISMVNKLTTSSNPFILHAIGAIYDDLYSVMGRGVDSYLTPKISPQKLKDEQKRREPIDILVADFEIPDDVCTNHAPSVSTLGFFSKETKVQCDALKTNKTLTTLDCS